MKRRDLLVGGGLAVVLVVAFLLARDPGGGGPEDFDLDVTSADGELVDLGVTVAVTAEPRPLRVFAPLRFTFRFTRDGEPVDVAEPRIGFNMLMDMGPNDYALVRDEAGAWAAEGVKLPQCGSGSRLWFGELTFTEGGRDHTVRLKLELDPPRTD